jgi:hypothetical protein
MKGAMYYPTPTVYGGSGNSIMNIRPGEERWTGQLFETITGGRIEKERGRVYAPPYQTQPYTNAPIHIPQDHTKTQPSPPYTATAYQGHPSKEPKNRINY